MREYAYVVAAAAAWVGFVGLVTPAVAQDAPQELQRFEEQVEEATDAIDSERAADTPPQGLLPERGGATTTDADVPLTTNRMISTMPGRGKKGGTYLELRPFGNYAFGADLDGGGDFSVGRAGLQLRTEYWLERFLTLTFDVNYEYSGYDFGGTLANGVADPLDDATRFTIRPGARMALSRELQVFAGAGLQYSGETGVDVDDALIPSGFLGGRYKLRDDLAITFGVSAAQEIEDDLAVFPIIGVRWDIDDLWRFDLGGAIGGFQAQLSFTPSEKWTIAGAWRLEARDYRLDEDNPNPLGVLRDDRMALELTGTYKPNAWSELTAGVGAVVYGELDIENSNGNELLETEFDPTPYVSLRGRIRF